MSLNCTVLQASKLVSRNTDEHTACLLALLTVLNWCGAIQHNAHGPRSPIPQIWCCSCSVQHATRTTSGPPSTGAAIAMDGGGADTQPALTQAVSRRRFEGGRRSLPL